MNNFTRKLGMWSSGLITLSFIGWIICFVGIALTSPLLYWTNLTDYLNFINTYNQTFQTIAKTLMWLFGPLFLLLIYSFYNYIVPEKKDFLRIGLLFGLAFTILSSIHYFIQISSVRLLINHSETEGLSHLLQANPISVISAINMLGWTFFLGLCSLFIAPAFQSKGKHLLLKIAFTFNGISCLIGSVSYLFQIDIVTFICMNLCLGGAILVISITSFFIFKKLPKFS